MAMLCSDSKAPLRPVKRVQFGILSPDEIVSVPNIDWKKFPLAFDALSRLAGQY